MFYTYHNVWVMVVIVSFMLRIVVRGIYFILITVYDYGSNILLCTKVLDVQLYNDTLYLP